FFSSRRRHTRWPRDWSSDVCSSDLDRVFAAAVARAKTKVDPSISVILANGMRLPATVAKYSPPVAGESMSGRDLALLKVETADRSEERRVGKECRRRWGSHA